MKQLKEDMNKSGTVLNKAKKAIEKELERPIVTSENHIELTQNDKLIETK